MVRVSPVPGKLGADLVVRTEEETAPGQSFPGQSSDGPFAGGGQPAVRRDHCPPARGGRIPPDERDACRAARRVTIRPVAPRVFVTNGGHPLPLTA